MEEPQAENRKEVVKSSSPQKPSNLWEESDEEDDLDKDIDQRDQWAFNQIADSSAEAADAKKGGEMNRLSSFMLAGEASEVDAS